MAGLLSSAKKVFKKATEEAGRKAEDRAKIQTQAGETKHKSPAEGEATSTCREMKRGAYGESIICARFVDVRMVFSVKSLMAGETSPSEVNLFLNPARP